MRKRNLWILGVLAIAVVSAAAVAVFLGREPVLTRENDTQTGDTEEWGQILAENAEKVQNLSMTEDKDEILKLDIEQTKAFYILKGLSEEEAQEKAVAYVQEREALYQEAIEHGYTVTDEEVWEYLEQLKGTIANAENGEAAQLIMEQFDSEEDYWNYEFYVYQKNLPIEKYAQAKKFVE